MKTIRSAACVVAALTALTLGSTVRPARAATCAVPTVNTLISAEAAVSRPVIASPSEYGLGNVYSQISQATKPLFTYAEAGPQYAGVFEALAPAGTPPLIRAVSAYPSEDIPDDSTAEWGGTSHTVVSSSSASAESNGARSLGVGGATAKGARSWTTSTVVCDVVTIVAGWGASEVVLAPGVTASQMGEVLTMIIGPGGGSAKVDTTLVGLSGAQAVQLEGRPADGFTDPVRAGGGPRVEAGAPRTSADRKGGTASGGGFNFLFTDPGTGQGAGYRIGSIAASVSILGPLGKTIQSVPGGGDGVGGDAIAAASRPGRGTRTANGVLIPTYSGSTSAAPADASPAATAVGPSAAVDITDAFLSSVTVTSRSWVWAVLLGGLMLMLGAAAAMARVWPSRFPTLAWLVRNSDRSASRLAAVYLKW